MKWIMLSLFSLSTLASIVDKYQNFAALSENEVQNQDYQIFVNDRSSPITLFAIHGGSIEPGTGELAQALAADKLNLYVFEGLKKKEPTTLHITATRFDEPMALALANRSQSCVSIHGYLGNGSKAICVGGNDQKLATHIVSKLQANNFDFEVIFPCKPFPGTHPKNIVNRCLNKGVQLEISQGLWIEFAENDKLENEVIRVLKAALKLPVSQR